ncbi:hypothetical protein [Devosia sp.]|uniref:hypothetical protein n=1 Tax=Devosia sp. TaxID=1871048 RepID=UPI0035B2D1EF
MPDTILGRLGDGLARLRARLLTQFILTNLRSILMSLGFLDGFKTYLVAAAMVLAALSQLIGVDLPSFEGQSAGQLLMEGLAVLFLRRGMKG